MRPIDHTHQLLGMLAAVAPGRHAAALEVLRAVVSDCIGTEGQP